MTVTIDRDLTSATWEQLAELVGHADETVMAAALAEGERRDRAERYRVKAQAKRRAFYEEWREAAHSSYLAAEAYTNGYMLSDVGKRTVTDPFSLWSGPEKRAMILASEEMREFWRCHQPRLTYTEWLRQRSAGLRAQREEYEGERMKATCDHPARWEADSLKAPCHDCPRKPAPSAAGAFDADAARRRAADREARRIAASERAGITPAPSQVPGVGTAVAVADADEIVPAATYAPRRQRPDAAQLLRRLLEEIGMHLCEYIQFPSRAAVVAVVLWIAHAAARDEEEKLLWRASPRLLLTSAQNGSGKSTLMDLIAILLRSRAKRLIKVTAAGLIGILNELHDVGLPDDAQLIFGTTGAAAKDLQSVLLGSYSKHGTCVTGQQTVRVRPVFGPVVVAGKDQLITTQKDKLTDLLARSVIIRMERPRGTCRSPMMSRTARVNCSARHWPRSWAHWNPNCCRR